ncbi:MAG: glycosyl transferase [Bacteroidetes bacterium HGW-Bacteroidetes-7]|nr:MAG: glycosyl transferase [Bacteroidetes bacterium HGW-Bacteroidetes-7]
MKIAILSCFYPYRGGIAQFNANLHNELGNKHQVRAFNFKRQYPGLLFPGKTQYVTNEDVALKIDSTPLLDTINPFSFISTAREIRKFAPDLLIMRYWMSFFAPSLGYVARHMNPGTKVISVLDNVVPHEKRFFDTPFTKYFLNSNPGHKFIVLSESVGEDLLRLKPDAKYIHLPHPLYNHFGEKCSRADAQKRLGIDPAKKTLLFFGLIREYKGLDILLEAFDLLDESYQLIIAGEPYGSFDLYQKKIDNSPGKSRIYLHTRYIADNEVSIFFGASDVVVLPYRSATQSGISAISYHFDVPMITTDVGGLKEAVGKPGTGVVVDYPDGKLIAKGIIEYFEKNKADYYIKNIQKLKEQLSWSVFAERLTDFYEEK